jgi:hypothetical protein
MQTPTLAWPSALGTISAPLWLAHLASRLVEMLRAEGITDPLSERLTLAAVLADLFALAGVAMPADVAAHIGD